MQRYLTSIDRQTSSAAASVTSSSFPAVIVDHQTTATGSPQHVATSSYMPLAQQPDRTSPQAGGTLVAEENTDGALGLSIQTYDGAPYTQVYHQTAATAAADGTEGFRRQPDTQSPPADPYYVTGGDVQQQPMTTPQWNINSEQYPNSNTANVQQLQYGQLPTSYATADGSQTSNSTIMTSQGELASQLISHSLMAPQGNFYGNQTSFPLTATLLGNKPDTKGKCQISQQVLSITQ